MVSDVNGEVKEANQTAERVAARPAPSSQLSPSIERTEPYQSSSTPSSGMSSATKWLIGIVAGIAVINWLGSLESKQETPAPAPMTNEQPPPEATQLTAPTAPAPDSVIPAALVEEQPPVSSNLAFTANQIRYCVSESIRMDAAKSHVNTSISSDVDRFNTMVADYNARCNSFRYRTDDLERVRSEVEINRAQLLQEGVARFPDANQMVQQSRYDTASTMSPQYQAPGRDDGANDNASAGAASQLTQDDRSSIEAVCSSVKYLKGPEAYKQCVQNQLNTLDGSPNPDVSGLSMDDNSSIQSVCSGDKYTRGPAAYRRCVQNQVTALATAPAAPDLTELSMDETSSLQSVCSGDKFTRGPTAYRRCLRQQIAALQNAPRPDTSSLNYAEKQQANIACNTDKFTRGPAAYNLCIAKQLTALGH